MIIQFLGLPGSGKTASAVRYIMQDGTGKKTYTNIAIKNLKNAVLMNSSMIVKKEIKGYKKCKGGDETPIYDFKFNQEFWQENCEAKNIVLDEIHTMFNSRRPGAKINIILSDFLAMIRRVLGQSPSGEGDCILISQLDRRIDVIGRDMSTQIRYHIGHVIKSCLKCGLSWQENSEMPERIQQCPKCKKWKLKEHSHKTEVWHFANNRDFQAWREWNQKSYYRHYIINDIEKVFPHYDTLQWENMLSEFY